MSDLTIVSWCSGGACDPCRRTGKYYYIASTTVTKTISVFQLSSIFTSHCFYVASGELAGQCPGQSIPGDAGWPGYLPFTGFIWPHDGLWTASQDVQYYGIFDQNGVDINPGWVTASLSQVFTYYDGNIPNQYWGYASLSGGFTWNEPGWLGDPGHSHTVGDGGAGDGSDTNVYYGEIATPDGEGGFTYSVIVMLSRFDGDMEAFAAMNKQRIWSRVDQITRTGHSEVIFMDDASEYTSEIENSGYTTTVFDGDGGLTETVYTISPLNDWPVGDTIGLGQHDSFTG